MHASPPPPKALFFDAAGTLVDLAEPVGAVYARHFAEAGFPCPAEAVDKAFRQFFVTSAGPDFSGGRSGEEVEIAWWRALVAGVFHHSHPDDGDFLATPGFDALFSGLFAHYADPGAWTVFPDVIPTLERAHRRARLVVLSNFDDRLHGIFEGLGLADYFHRLVTSSDARARKPDPRIFEHALALTGVRPAEAAHVGDSPDADLAGAEAAGIRAYLVERPRNSLPDFLAFCGIGPK